MLKVLNKNTTTTLLLKCMHLLNINERVWSLTLTFTACLSELAEDGSINNFSCLNMQMKSKCILHLFNI